MSVLSYPRIHFKGKCLINPGTCDNDDVVINVDVANVGLLPGLVAMSDDQAREWLVQGVPAVNVLNGMPFWFLKCGWNYFGDMSTTFEGLKVTAIVDANGRLSSTDPICGGPVRILGREASSPVICDQDAAGTTITQLFVGGLLLGDGRPWLIAEYDTRAYSRWVIFRNASVYQGEQGYPGFGATWQFAIPSSALTFDLPRSPSVLAELQEAMDTNLGILVQFCFYLAEPRISDRDLIQLYQRGCHPPNPAEAYVVGTVGIWETGDLMTAPGGRFCRLLQAPPDTENPLSIPLGPAIARVHPERAVVSLNMITTFPEANYDRPPTRKAYVGPVRLGLIPASTTTPVPISEPLAYGYANYERTGGILDVGYDQRAISAAQLNAGTLVLLADRYPNIPILTEEYSTITVETDDRAVYLDKGQRGEIKILVQERGGPPVSDVPVYLSEYQNVTYPGGDLQRAYSILVPVGSRPSLRRRITNPSSVVFPAGRTEAVPIPFAAVSPGALVLSFALDASPPQVSYPWGTGYFAGVRVMPEDDYTSFPKDERISWDFVYREVFRYYHLIFPAMSDIHPLNNEKAMTLIARTVVEMSDPCRWNTTRYMPPTRDLSTGKRQLLIEWADAVAPKQ